MQLWMVGLWVMFSSGQTTVIPYENSPVFETYIECKQVTLEHAVQEPAKEAAKQDEITQTRIVTGKHNP